MSPTELRARGTPSARRVALTGAGIWAVAQDTGRVLLLRRSNAVAEHAGLWNAPSGHVEPGESAVAAALREFEEETGYGGPLLGLMRCDEEVSDDGRLYVRFGALVPREFVPKLNWESDDWGWFDDETMPPDEQLHPGLRRAPQLIP